MASVVQRVDSPRAVGRCRAINGRRGINDDAVTTSDGSVGTDDKSFLESQQIAVTAETESFVRRNINARHVTDIGSRRQDCSRVMLCSASTAEFRHRNSGVADESRVPT